MKFAMIVPPGAFTDEGAKLACMPEGRPVALSETLPVSPPKKATVIVSVGFVPGGNEIVVGEAEMVKLGAETTVRLSAAVLTVEPLVPVTSREYVPGTAVAEAVSVRLLPAAPVTEAGLKVAVTPVGRPVTLNAMVPLKPPVMPTVMLLVAVVPWTMLTDPVVVRLNELVPTIVGGTAGNAFWTNMSNSVSQNVPAGGEFGIAPVGLLLARALSWAGSQFGSPSVEVTPLKTLPG